MTMVDVGPFAPYIPLMAVAANTSGVIDAASEVEGGVFRVKAGNIRYIHWRTGTVTTGGANNVDVRVETVSATTGEPTGTLWGTNTNASVDVLDSDDNTWFRTQLTADATVAVGDAIAVLVVNPATSFGNMQIMRGHVTFHQANNNSRAPYCVGPLRSNLTTGTPSCMYLEYDDGSFNPVFGYIPLIGGSQAYNTTSGADEVCLVFTPDAPFRIFGLTAAIGLGTSAADWRGALYQDGNNTPLLTTGTIDASIVPTTASGGFNEFFSSSYVVQVGVKYRLSIVALTSTSVTVFHFTTATATKVALSLAQFQIGKRDRSSTTDPDSAAWTDTEDIPCIWPIADQMDNGVSSGASVVGRRDYRYRGRRGVSSVYSRV